MKRVTQNPDSEKKAPGVSRGQILSETT